VFSHQRHIRKFAKSAAFVAASSILFVAATQATEVTGDKLMLTAYVNGSGGESLMSGKYDVALAEMATDRANGSTAYSAKMNNLCVAYAAKKQLTEAKVACTAAVKAAKYDRLSSQRFAPGSSRENSYVAIAYTNRAVVSMLTKDEAGAKEDLARAKSLAPTAEFVSRNLAAVQNARSTIAKLDVAPAR
jgi:hypothetical protein